MANEITNEEQRDDFIGFSFGGVHSSTLGIKRTSDGSRFNENLLPTIQDKTVQVPGGDGTYYFGSYYTQRQLNISFAFDSLSEVQFRKLKQWLGDKKIKELIFDEAPYKVYNAKITGNATIKHICFDVEGARVYKGEGSIQFTCYYPFAHSPKGKKFLSGYNNENINEWAAASGMLSERGEVDDFSSNTKSTKIYNPGDIETDFILTLKFDTNGQINISNINLGAKTLWFSIINKKDNDTFIRISSKNNLVEGLDDKYAQTGNIYNEYITKGEFFKIPVCSLEDNISFGIDTETNLTVLSPELEYNYLYF